MAEVSQARGVTAEMVRGLCGDVLDWKVAAIVALEPSAADVAAAVEWAAGQDDLGGMGRPLSGLSAQVYDLLRADEEFGEER